MEIEEDDVKCDNHESSTIVNPTNSSISKIKVAEGLHTGNLVAFLLENRFLDLSYEDKVYIVKKLGRPCPKMKNLVNVSVMGPRRFSVTWYDKCKWLTGCELKNKLYCWPCLLFCNNSSPWKTTGMDNVKNLCKSTEKHDNSKEHTYSNLKLIQFGEEDNSRDSDDRSSITKYNEKVKENRDHLRRFIDMMIYLTSQDHVENYKKRSLQELAEFLNKYDTGFNEFLNDSSLYHLRTVKNDLLESINHVISNHIENEITHCVCFSWIVNEITDMSGKSQLSVIFRYTYDGCVKQRFMGFYDVNNGRTADDIFKLLHAKYEKFNLKEKLIGQSYDGASVNPSELNKLQSQVKFVAPQALFTYCYGHQLNLVLQDIVSNLQECKIFFATLSGLSSFFCKSSKRINILEEISKQRWNFKSHVISTIIKQRKTLIEALKTITVREDFARDLITIHEANAFIYFLNEFDTLFLLQVLDLIFQQTDFSIIRYKRIDIPYCNSQISDLLTALQTYRDEQHYFLEIYNNTTDILGIPTKRRKTNTSESTPYKRLYSEIFDLISTQVKIRFSDIKKFYFFDLLETSLFEIYDQKFPFDLLDSLMSNYSNIFQKDKLENELKRLYSDPSILGHSADLTDKLSFIVSNSLQNVFPEIYKLLSLVLSLPGASNEGFSVSKRIRTLMGSTICESRLISAISIETEFVKSLTRTPDFFDQVIDHFAASTDHHVDLIYKRV